MARSTPLDSAEVPVINIDGAQWQQIERAYGSSLPPTVRAEIIKATEAFAFLQSFELTAERLAKVRIVLEAHEKAAIRLFNELFVGPTATSEAGMYAHFLVEANFKPSPMRGNVAALDVLVDALREFYIACNASIRQLNELSSSPSRNEDAWRIWIKRLADILSDIEPTRKNECGEGDFGKTQHPWVGFIWELQKCLSAEWHHASEAALSHALRETLFIRGKSRFGSGFPPNSTTRI